MTFPDGRIKDGYFENNIFKGKTEVQEGSEVEKIMQDEKQSTINESPIKLSR